MRTTRFRRHGQQGRTIIECLVAAVLLVMLTSMATMTFQMGWSAFRQGDIASPGFRGASTTLERMVAELRNVTHIYSPEQSTLEQGFRPSAATKPFVFVFWAGGAPQVVAYRERSVAEGGVERFVYDLDFSPELPAHQTVQAGSESLLGQGVRDCRIRYRRDELDHEYLTVSLLSRQNDPLESGVCIRVGYPAPTRPVNRQAAAR